MPIRSTDPEQAPPQTATGTWQPGKKRADGSVYTDRSRGGGGGGGGDAAVTGKPSSTETMPPPETHKSWTPTVVGAVVVGAAAFVFGAPLLFGVLGAAVGGVVARLLTKPQVQS